MVEHNSCINVVILKLDAHRFQVLFALLLFRYIIPCIGVVEF